MIIEPVRNYKHALFPKGDVTQWFGENPRLYAPMGLAGHNGIDIVRPHGEAMLAVEDGIVVSVKNDPGGYGKNIRFVGDEKDVNGNQREWVYAHNHLNLVKQGDRVTAGQVIALMGNTGFVVSGNTPFWRNNPFRGTHLHLGVRMVKVVKRGGFRYEGSDVRLQVIDHGNGYKGRFDFADLLITAKKYNPSTEGATWRSLAMTVQALANAVINRKKTDA